MMRTQTVGPVILAAVAGGVIRAAASFALHFQPTGWGSHYFRLFAQFRDSGFANRAAYSDHGQDILYCVVVSLYPAVIGGMIGALAGSCQRYRTGIALGISLSILVVAAACSSAFFDAQGQNVTDLISGASRFLAEAALVGALIGGVAVTIRKSLQGGLASPAATPDGGK